MEIIHSKKLSFNRESGESQLHILIVLRKTNINSTHAKNFFNDNNSIKLQCISQEPSFKYPKVQRILFSYRYWWLEAKPRQWGAKRREKKTVYFKIGMLRKDLWSHGKFQVIIVKSLGALFSPKTRNIRYFFADSSLLKVCDCFHLRNVIPGCGWKRICNKAWHDF